MNAVVGKVVLEGWLGEAACHGNQHGLVILISILVDHHQNIPKFWDIRKMSHRSGAGSARQYGAG
jgi:hypothetical protein